MKNNKIYKSFKSGIWISGGDGIFVNNSIYSNKYTNVLISGKSNPIIKKNLIEGSDENGIKISENASGIIKKNIIKGKIY
jgi:parallel beta-helix repeat protein